MSETCLRHGEGTRGHDLRARAATDNSSAPGAEAAVSHSAELVRATLLSGGEHPHPPLRGTFSPRGEGPSAPRLSGHCGGRYYVRAPYGLIACVPEAPTRWTAPGTMPMAPRRRARISACVHLRVWRSCLPRCQPTYCRDGRPAV